MEKRFAVRDRVSKIPSLASIVGSEIQPNLFLVQLEGANLTQGMAWIAPCENINNHFLLWVLRSTYAQQQFDLVQYHCAMVGRPLHY